MSVAGIVDACVVDGFRIEARGVADVQDDVKLKWNLKSPVVDDIKLKWYNLTSLEDDVTLKWHTLSSVEDYITLKWIQRSFVEDDIALKWDELRAIGIACIVDRCIVDGFRIEARGIADVEDDIKLKWNDGWVHDDIKLKWNDAFVTGDIKLKWINRSYLEDDVTLKWLQRSFVEDDITLKWLLRSFVTDDIKLKWLLRSFVEDDIALKWILRSFVEDDITLKWLQGPPLAGLVDYLEVITPQGDVIYPDIITMRGELKTFATTDRVTFDLKEPIPEDAKCRLYLAGSVIYFEGISRSCIQKYTRDESYYRVEVYGYPEILKPVEPKGGLYLTKNVWENVTVSQLLASDKPSDNDDLVGLLYMASSAIDFEFWALHDSTYHIYKFEYEGAAFSISEVFEDGTLLTNRASVAALQSASGWYHDTSNKILYVRLTNDDSPYYHVVSAPYIWDGIMPVRLGVVSAGGSTNIIYWETANGDIPIENIDMLLKTVSLEATTSVRNGICYVDVGDRAGSGTENAPAQSYHSAENIKDINEVTLNDARFTVAGVILTGYGAGSGAVHAGAFRNMGRGGRKVRLDDSSMYSTSLAQNYVANYLDDAFLPNHGISFDAPLRVGPSIDHRRVGDTVKIEVPAARFNQVLRIQSLKPDLAKNLITISAGDRLYTLEDQLAAIKKANDKYRKHLEDEIETFSWNWEENLTSGLDRSTTFDITADALLMQKLELSASISKMVIDGALSNPTTGHDHTSSTGGSGVSAHGSTGSNGSHYHGVDGATVNYASGTKYNLYYGSSGSPSTSSNGSHSHSVASHSHSIGTSSISGHNHYEYGAGYYTSVNGGYSHSHSGATGSSGSSTGSDGSHSHTLSMSQVWGVSSDHGHSITGQTTSTIDTHLHSGSGDHSTQYHSVGETDSGQQIVEANSDESLELDTGHSDTEMYLTIKIDGTEITGSPFSVEAGDDIGPVAIDELAATAGTHTVLMSVSNKTVPAETCRCKVNIKLLGRIYVSTIVS